jgi:hypothetical protein
MIASRLAATVFELSMGSDMSTVTREDIIERFESLRGYGKLPRGRERRNQKLTHGEIAAAILGLVPPNPKWAGHAATILCNLRTVGGASASFYGAITLQEAIERVLADGSARRRVVRLGVSGGDSGTNSHGAAMLVYEDDDRHQVFYVPKEAVSQLQAGMEQRFDCDVRHSPVSRELSFNGRFFERLAKAIELAKSERAPPEGDGSEYAAEGAREAHLNSTVLITLTPEQVLSAAGTLWQAPGDQTAETEGHRRDRVGNVSLHRCETRAGGSRRVWQVF